MKSYGLLLCAAALAAFSACNGGDSGYDASGVFETTEVIVSAKGTGEILALNAEEGRQVASGEVLGCIDTMQLTLKRRQLAAGMSATDSKRLDEDRQVAALKRQIDNLKRERTRFAELLEAKAGTAKQVDDIDYQISVLQRQLAATQEQISGNNASLGKQSAGIGAQIAQIDDQIRNSVITSPIRGVVMARYAEPGEYAVPGRALFKVADISRMKLRAYITADQLTSLKVGQKVKVFADQGKADRKEYNGTVAWISDRAEFTPKTIQTRDERANLVYAVKIEVRNDGLIKRGMYGDVRF